MQMILSEIRGTFFSFVCLIDVNKMIMTTNQHIERKDLFFRYCHDMVTPEEKWQVEKWVTDEPYVADELDRLRKALAIQEKINRMEAFDVSVAYARVHKEIRNRNRRRRWLAGIYRAAAILAFPLFISSLVFAYLAFHDDPGEIAYTELIAAPGVVARFELPDHSSVWLNSNSKLRYPVRFSGKTREVELEGEGYFEVQSDKNHPFYVTTSSGLKVMAYGTRFNVSAYDRTMETTLAEGKIALLNDTDLLHELRPGEEVTFHHETGRLDVQDVSLHEKLAWKDGKIIFRNAPLDKVFAQLSKRYNVDIVLHDEQHLLEKYSSRRVTFTNETIQQILSYLEIAAPIEWAIAPPEQKSDSTLVRQRIDVWLKKE